MSSPNMDQIVECSGCLAGVKLEDVRCTSCQSEALAHEYYKGAEDTRRAFVAALATPSCVTCVYGSWDADPSVGIPWHLDDCEFLPEDFDEVWDREGYKDEEQMYAWTAEKCGHWQIDPTRVGPQW